MRTKVAALVMLLLGLSDLAGCATVEFSTLASGVYSAGIKERVTEVFTDQASFDAFWSGVSSHLTPTTGAPIVDFSRDMVIAVSPGEMRTGGYSVEITKVTRDNKKVMVNVFMTKPTGIVTMALTQPYHVIKIERIDLPVEFTWVER